MADMASRCRAPQVHADPVRPQVPVGVDARDPRALVSTGRGAAREFVAPALVLLALLAYLPALHADYIFDDYSHMISSPTSHGLDGLWRIWTDPTSMPQYYPMTHTVWWLGYRLWGFKPSWMHLVNVLLHGGVAIALWRVFLRLQLRPAVAFVAAAVFAVHPVHVESAGYVSELKNVLSGLFACAAALAYFRFDRVWSDDADARRRWLWYVWAALLFLAALLSKTVAATFPVVMLVLIWWKQGHVRWRQIWPLLILTSVGIGMGLMTARLERISEFYASEFAFSPMDRLLIAGRAIVFYAEKLVWPHPLMLIYPRWDVDPGQWWQWLYPAAAAAAVVSLWLFRRRLGRGPVAGLAIFMGMLFPALGFVDVYPFRYSFVSDHYQYLPSAALIALAVACLAGLARRLPPLVPSGCVALVLVVMICVSVAHGQALTTQLSAWRDCAEKNPGSWVARANFGAALLNEGRLDEAQRHLDAALRLKPDADFPLRCWAELLSLQSGPEAAMHFLEGAIDKGFDHPRMYIECGMRCLRMGEVARARSYFSTAFELDRADPSARVGWGFALLEDGDDREAVAVITGGPNPRRQDPRLYEVLGRAYLGLADFAEAKSAFQQAVALAPTEMYYRCVLIAALARMGRHEEASQEVREALREAQRVLRYRNDTRALRAADQVRTLAQYIRRGQEPPLPEPLWAVGTSSPDAPSPILVPSVMRESR